MSLRRAVARSIGVGILAAAAAGLVFAPSAGPNQTKTIDLSSIPAASEYATDAPKGRGFFGSESAVLGRSLDRINKALGTDLRPDIRLTRMAQWIYDRSRPEPSLPQQSELELLTRQAQARLFELINEERAKAGLDALVFDPELSEAARGHSEDMRKRGFVGHLSPTSGSSEERLLKAGIVTDLAAENIGRGDSPDEIHKGLMDSPGHRSAILLPKTTHVGIGISSARKGDSVDYIVTELFIRRIPSLGPEAGLLVLGELAAGRELDGLESLKEEPALSELAGEAVRRYLDDPALSQEDVMDGLRRQLERSQAPKGAVTAVFIVAGSIKEGVARMEIDPKSWAAARRVGVGIAQGVRPGLIPNSIVLILVFSE